MKDRRRLVSVEEPPGAADDRFRPLDRRRIREIRGWLEGTRPDAPTRAELHEFETWVSQEIEWHLARRQPVQDLIGVLNAAREQLRRPEGRP